MQAAERRWSAMGGEAAVTVVVDDGAPSHLADALADAAIARVEELESRWSRFREGSDISRLARAAGRPTAVHDDTALLVEHLVHAWSATAGAFDPSVLPAVVAAGYDRSHDEPGPRVALAAGAAPGCGGVRIDRARGSVVLPEGVALDPGGMGKGLAADLVVEELLATGAAGACCSLGGDLRVDGAPPMGDVWFVAVEADDDPSQLVAELAIRSGGVATSAPLGRSWPVPGGVRRGHLVDPSTGLAPAGAPRSATVVAGTAWWAEAIATAACVAPGLAEREADRWRVSGRITLAGGDVRMVGADEVWAA